VKIKLVILCIKNYL